jgi:hypothetical protein
MFWPKMLRHAKTFNRGGKGLSVTVFGARHVIVRVIGQGVLRNDIRRRRHGFLSFEVFGNTAHDLSRSKPILFHTSLNRTCISVPPAKSTLNPGFTTGSLEFGSLRNISGGTHIPEPDIMLDRASTKDK